MNELANTLRMYAGSNHYDDKCADAMSEAADRLEELEDCDTTCREVYKALDGVPYKGSYADGIETLIKGLATEHARVVGLEKERDKLILAVADNATARCELAAQNVAFREALSWAERNMDAETLVQFASEDDCHCPFCNVADFPGLASEVLKRRDAEIDLAADRLEVLEREHAEFFDRWHGERRMREKLVDDVERCYRMLLSDPNTKSALFKAENILREALADAKSATHNAIVSGLPGKGD